MCINITCTKKQYFISNGVIYNVLATYTYKSANRKSVSTRQKQIKFTIN